MAEALGPRLRPSTILAIGYGAFVLYAFPGYLGWDALTQWAQARVGFYTDDHPPAMAALWRLLEHFLRGPLLMLIVQSLPFVVGGYAILGRVMKPRTAAFVAIGLLWTPPVCSLFGSVFKDCLMAGFIAIAIPDLMTTDSRRWRGQLWLVAATAFRYNALAATLPLTGLLFVAKRGASGWKRYALAAVTWFGVTAAAGVVNQVLTDEHVFYWSSSHAYQDIAGTLRWARDYSDDEMKTVLAGTPLVVEHDIQARMREVYQPTDFRQLRAGDTRVWGWAMTEAQRDANGRAWKQVIVDNPWAYLHYRWDNFAALMRFDGAVYDNSSVSFKQPREDLPEFDYDATYSHVQLALARKMSRISMTILFDPWPYALISLVLVGFAIAWRDRLAGALLSSGLVYQSAWFLLAPTADFRYSHYLIVTTLLGGVMLFAQRRGAVAGGGARNGRGGTSVSSRTSDAVNSPVGTLAVSTIVRSPRSA